MSHNPEWNGNQPLPTKSSHSLCESKAKFINVSNAGWLENESQYASIWIAIQTETDNIVDVTKPF